MVKSISDMMTKDVWTVDTEDTVDKIDVMFALHNVSSAPVMDARGDVFGIISAVDLLHFHAAHKSPKAVKAWELCTYRPIAVSPETSAVEVAKLMMNNKVHHILITENGTLHGIVSSLDFVKQYALNNGA
jgi:predicted transcriptional regulator